MMQVHLLVDLDHLPTARAKPVLLSQDSSTKRRRRPQRQLTVTIVEVCLPCGIERIGGTLDLEIALRFDCLLGGVSELLIWYFLLEDECYQLCVKVL
jgi:hypothetical protein